MKKSLLSLAIVAAAALTAVSCGKASASSSSTSDSDDATGAPTTLEDSIATYLGEYNGYGLNMTLSRQPGAAVDKAVLLEAFERYLQTDTGRTEAPDTTQSYMIGRQLGLQQGYLFTAWATQGLKINRRRFFRAFKSTFTQDSVNTGALDSLNVALGSLMQRAQVMAQAKAVEDAAKNKEEGTRYIARVMHEDKDVRQSPSGLAYRITESGTGVHPTDANQVTVHYTGKLIDGTVFDSSLERGEPATFPVKGVVPGFSEAIKLLGKGGKGTFYLPSSLAYGDAGAGDQIPPGATLVFEIELLEVK